MDHGAVIGILATALLALATLILQGVVLRRIDRLEIGYKDKAEKADLDKLRDRMDDRIMRTDCGNCRETLCRMIQNGRDEHAPIWDALDKHSHTGLTPDSRVVR